MALQGTLETFALADVLRLLASTKKSGVLRIEGDRGRGDLVVVDGELAAASASGAPRAERPAEVLFELLRYGDGSFVFDSDVDAAGRGDRRDNVEEALADAEEQLREWREIEAVVPSPTRVLTLVSDRGEADITLNGRQWKAVVALGGGCTTHELSERLGLSELPATRLVRDLVELGAIEIGDEVGATTAASMPERVQVPESESEPMPEPAPVADLELAPSSEPAPVVDLELAPSSEPAPVVDLEPAPSSEPAPAPPPASAPAGGSFADAPSFIAEPSSPAVDTPAPDRPLLHTDGPSSSTAFSPQPDAFRSAAEPPGFAPPPPTSAPTAEDPIAGWNDEPDDGLSSFHDDSDSVPLFNESEQAPGPDDPFGPDPFQIPSFGSAQASRESEEAAEMARQLANLSPRAQQAVAAAAAANTDEEREQAISQAEDASGEPINRNLLLKYLSSVDE